MVNNRKVLDSGSLAIIITLCILASLGGVFFALPASGVNFGLFLPSPNLWPIEILWGNIICICSIFLSAGCIYFLNKHFSIIKTAQPIWASIFLPLCCCNPLLTGHFNQGSFCFLMILCSILFLLNSYKQAHAAKKVFSAALFIAWGALSEYAFLLFIPALFVGLAEMKIFRLKEIFAALAGLIIPFWITFGLGLLNPLDINIPDFQPVFMTDVSANLFPLVIITGLFLLATLLLMLNNGMKLYAGNSQLRNYVNLINIFGLSAAAGMIFDFANIPAYIMIFYMWVALQLGIIYTIWNIKMGYVIFRIVEGVIFVSSIIMSIYLIALPLI